MMISALTREEYKQGRYLATPLWLYKYGGLEELYGSAKRWDPSLPREFKEYFDEAVEGLADRPQQPTRILFEVGGNLLRRVRGYDRMIDNLLPEARSARHRRLAHEQHRALQRLRLPGGRLVREGRHHLGLAHHALQPRHHRGRRAPRRLEDRLGVPLPVPEDAAAARQGARNPHVQGPQPARRGASTRSTTSSPSAGATPRRTPRSSSTRCSSSPRTSAASAGRSSRRRATRATRVSA